MLVRDERLYDEMFNLRESKSYLIDLSKRINLCTNLYCEGIEMCQRELAYGRLLWAIVKDHFRWLFKTAHPSRERVTQRRTTSGVDLKNLGNSERPIHE